jgi:hypothetical protein
MNNFNLRYECNDARDDYTAKLKKEEDEGTFFPSWASSDVLKDLDHNTFTEYDDDSPIDIATEESAYLEPSSKHLDKLQEMSRMENVVQNAGWLDACPQNINQIDPKGLQLNINISGSKWSSIVKTAKDIELMRRRQHLPVNEDECTVTAKNYNDVVVDDISYLRKNFKAEQADKQKIVDDTVKEFELNEEQEQAF